MRQLRQWERLPPREFEQAHVERLGRILPYARDHVPLYRSGPWHETLRDGQTALVRWPVLERDVLAEQFDELLARPRPRRIVTRGTSGGTGTRARVAFTLHADTWGWAHRYRGLLWHGIPIGTRSLRLSQDRRPFRDLLLDHRSVPDLSTSESIEEAARFLRDKRPPLVAGPPSALFYLARQLRGRGVNGRLAPFARVGGEQLFGFQRAEIEAVLGARVIDSYGCTEIGALAGECPAGAMHVYADHVHLEIFHGDSPAPPGEHGDIVATALHNPAMPLVRYRVGDRGRLSEEPCSCGLPHPVLLDLQARLGDTFAAVDGTRRHGSALAAQLEAFFRDPAAAGVLDLQFAQLDPSCWEVHVEAGERLQALHEEDPRRIALKQRLGDVVRAAFGAACRVELRLVGRLPRQRGKFRYYRAL